MVRAGRGHCSRTSAIGTTAAPHAGDPEEPRPHPVGRMRLAATKLPAPSALYSILTAQHCWAWWFARMSPFGGPCAAQRRLRPALSFPRRPGLMQGLPTYLTYAVRQSVSMACCASCEVFRCITIFGHRREGPRRRPPRRSDHPRTGPGLCFDLCSLRRLGDVGGGDHACDQTGKQGHGG